MLIDNNQIALEEKWKDRQWCKEVLKQSEYRFLEQAIPVIRKVYGDNWDLELIFEEGEKRVVQTNQYGYEWTEYQHGSKLRSFNFKIHFPEIYIENSRSSTPLHLIKDLFIKLTIHTNGGGFELKDIQGLRATVSEREYKRKYEHSHLHTKDYDKESRRKTFSDFCLGSGGDDAGALKLMQMKLQAHIPTLCSANNYTLNIALFKLFLLQIKEYVIWESIEGVPYVSISTMDIVPNNSSYDNADIGDSISKDILKRFLDSYSIDNLPPLIWNISNGKHKVVKGNYLHNLLLPFVDESQHFYKDETGKFYRDSDIIPENLNTTTDLFLYHGSTVQFKVYETSLPPVLPPNRQKYVHHYIINYVKSELETKLNQKTLISSYLQRQNTLSLT